MKLQDKAAIVTGGAMGIGFAIAQALGRAGAAVLIADLDGAEAAAAQLREQGIRASGITADVAVESDMRHMAAQADEAFGGVDVLVLSLIHI
jgi:NAD(P)-dependent dehydrogenase (short-subunit alcohol dehydrogenase family)